MTGLGAAESGASVRDIHGGLGATRLSSGGPDMGVISMDGVDMWRLCVTGIGMDGVDMVGPLYPWPG